MNSQFYFFLLFLSILSSCGVKTNSPTTKATSAPSFLSLNELHCESTQPLAVYSNSVLFSNRVTTFTTSYNLSISNNSANLPAINERGANLFVKSSPLKPLVLGKTLLEESLLNLESRFKQVIGKNNHESLLGVTDNALLFSPFTLEEKLHFEQVVVDTRELLTKALRWQSLQCSLEELSRRKKRDVRKFFFYQEEINRTEIDKEKVSEAALDLCGDFHRPAICLSEQRILERKNLSPRFNNHYEKLGKEKVDTFFTRHGKHRFSCRRESNRVVLEIPYVADHVLAAKLGRTLSKMEENVSSRWSNGRLLVLLKKVNQKSEGVLNFNWKDGGLSFVDRSKPLTMNLSQMLSNNLLMLTINHELGHVLGFPDCYHEFYDQKQKNVIYYSLDRNAENLMCTMSQDALIPDLYFDQLIESACTFN